MEKIDFQHFLEQFPELSLPFTLRTETYEELSAGLDPLHIAMIEQYIMDEEEEDDAMTEYIACCRLPKHDNYEAIVYWRAGLLAYEYILKTYTKDGVGVIDSQVIAGTVVKDDIMVESIATIQDDRIIYIAIGASDVHTLDFDTSKNKVRHLEIFEDGTIVES
jgi:hypothetical protein